MKPFTKDQPPGGGALFPVWQLRSLTALELTRLSSSPENTLDTLDRSKGPSICSTWTAIKTQSWRLS
eukprot:CAMPEP_0170616506 /NCGR_PEP_ID=MMETSP0224-20130122/25905_1 /TAXON_ID=285029 /ORGANISM="Togula jolla, Strain CCCM 725" /LENGTH=66 /DNA_ID=CAMNT_0010942305 /DNA_START=668 /DNA_END=868 /DNA_ORIENTATION=+